MKLSKQFTTVTTLSKTIALLLFISMPFAGFLCGSYYQKKIDSIVQIDEMQKLKAQNDTMIQSVRDEMSLILQDKAQLIKRTESIFDPATFRSYSPLLEKKNVISKTYKYRSTEVQHLTVQIDPMTTVDLWRYPKELEPVYSFLVDPNDQEDTIIVRVQHLDVIRAQSQGVYTSKDGLEYEWNTANGFRQIDGITLDRMIAPYTSTDNYSFLRISRKFDEPQTPGTPPNKLHTKNELKKIADTFTYRKLSQ